MSLHITPSVSFGSQAFAGADATGLEASGSFFDSPPSVLRSQSMPADAASARHMPVAARMVSVGVFVPVTVSRASDATASEADGDYTGTPPAIDLCADDMSSLSSFASSRRASSSESSDIAVYDNDVDESTGTPPQLEEGAGERSDKVESRASSVSSSDSLSFASSLEDDESVVPGAVDVGADYSLDELDAIHRDYTASSVPQDRRTTSPSGR